MSSQVPAPRRRVTIHELARMKAAGDPIAVVTAYDATAARWADAAGVDVILVGDSLGMVVQGHDSTLPVTLDQMVYHGAAVRRGLARGSGRPHLVVDMPFGSYHASVDEAVKAAARLVAEGGAEAVKLEGGAEFVEVVKRITRAGVPVMGHIGLTPQSVHKMGGYVVQGKDADKAALILKDALALEAAGCYAIVLECVPEELARVVSGRLSIPTIGIGAGVHCDGQVLVLNDLLGMDPSFTPKFVKHFATVSEAATAGIAAYVAEVKGRTFPDDAHSFHAPNVRLLPLPALAGDDEEPHGGVMGAPV
ncbi:MAG: 3-methyl-2-oxobutanoate hydroxymethyltransferase [Anaeromyxobacteraceae bacterium]